MDNYWNDRDTRDGEEGSGTGGTDCGHDKASSTHSYHNGGVEGDSFATWYESNLSGEFSSDTSDAGEGQATEEKTVLDLSNAGAAYSINVTENEDGQLFGSVKFLDEDGNTVAWGHFGPVDEIRESEDPGSHYYSVNDDGSIDGLEVIGDHGPDKPLKVSLDQFTETETMPVSEPETDDNCDNGTGGTKCSGSGGTKGSGSGGTGGSGSGGTKGSGSGGTKGSGSGGTKGSGSGGTSGCGTSGSGDTATQVSLPIFTPYDGDDDEMTLDQVMALMCKPVEDDAANGSTGSDDCDDHLDIL